KRAGREHVGAFGDLERCKPQISGLAQRPPTQEPAGLEKRQAMPVARLEKVGAIAIVQLLGDLLARSLLGPMLVEESEKVAGDLGAQALAQQTQRRARPLRVAEPDKRQVEQPLAGIIDNPEGERRRASGDLTHELAERAGRRETHLDPDL